MAFRVAISLVDTTAWLGGEDSNRQMSISKMPFEMCGEFAPISEIFGDQRLLAGKVLQA